ncbi:hypothetical protein [[Eubacterium] cellulosolvens]
MKKGYTAGAVAGFCGGVFAFVSQVILALVGVFPSVILEVLPSAAIIHIGMTTIWAVVFGVIYAKFYDVIPGKGVKKGLVFGFIIYLLADLWAASYFIANQHFQAASSFIFSGFFHVIIYGPLLGVLYKKPVQQIETKHKIKNNPMAGLIAGFFGGIVVAVLTYTISIVGVPYLWYWPTYPLITSIRNVVLIEIILMIVWGVILEMIFVIFYAKLPGKGIMKGFYFGLLISLLCVVHTTSWGIPYAANPQGNLMGFIIYTLAFICYGIVLARARVILEQEKVTIDY